MKTQENSDNLIFFRFLDVSLCDKKKKKTQGYPTSPFEWEKVVLFIEPQCLGFDTQI